MNKREVGGLYEALAADYIKKQGYVLLEQNFRCRQGEIDMIARDDEVLVFLEVKYRADASMGDPAEAVTFRKQQHIRRTAQYYLYQKGYSEETPCRFDVICILGDKIRLIENAF